jgi:hypothetical protein
MCWQLLKKKLTAASEARHPSFTVSVSLRQAATALRQVWFRSCRRDAAIHGDGSRSMSGTKIAGDALISALSFAEHSCLQLMRRWRGGALACDVLLPCWLSTRTTRGQRTSFARGEKYKG